MFRWPEEFDDKTPVIGFDTATDIAFSIFLNETNAGGSAVHADASWTSFSLSHGIRSVIFIRRGRHHWEVRLFDGNDIRLGPLFGLGEYACVTVNLAADIQAVAEHWLRGDSVQCLLKSVVFYDRVNATESLTPKKKDA